MNTSKSKNLIKWSSVNNESKSSMKLKPLYQKYHSIDRHRIESPRKNQINNYPSYPIIQYQSLIHKIQEQKSQQPALQRKTSAFLRNYHEKLKRERKRQSKRKSSVNPRFQQSSLKKQTKNISEQVYESLLVFKRSSLLDTVHSNLFKTNKDYTKDTQFQDLLKQINRLKRIQQKQIQKVQSVNFDVLQSLKSTKNNNSERQTIYKDSNVFLKTKSKQFQTPHRKFFSNTVAKYNSSLQNMEQQNEINSKSSRKNDKVSIIDRFYNFKKLEPWQNHKQNNYHSIPTKNSIEFMKDSLLD